MKGRYGVVFWTSLACLIGLSWLASRFRMSTWSFAGVHVLMMSAVCVLAFVGARRDARTRAPAIIAFVVSLPTLLQCLYIAPDLVPFTRHFGLPFVAMFAGSVAASSAALVVAVMRPRADTRPVPSARVVDRSPPEEP